MSAQNRFQFGVYMIIRTGKRDDALFVENAFGKRFDV